MNENITESDDAPLIADVGDLPDIAQVFPGFELYVEGSGITGERAECCAGTAHLVCTQPTDM